MRYLYTSWHFCIPTYRLHGTRTVRCWYDNQTAEDTSPRRFSRGVCVGCANGLRARSRGRQVVPSHRGPAGEPRQPAVPGGGPARGAPARCDNGGVWLWCGVWRLVCVGTWCAPVLREGRCRVKDAHTHVTHPLSWL